MSRKDCLKLTKRQALRLMNWHDGQSSDVYAVASNAFAGKCLDPARVHGALRELRLARGHSLTVRERRSLEAQIRLLDGKVWG